MKKICFFVHNINGSGGDTRVAVNIINGLIERIDCQITVITLKDIIKYRKKSFTLNEKVKVISITHDVQSLKKEFMHIQYIINNHFRNNKYDVLVVSGMDFVPLLFLSLPLLRKTKKVAWEHMNFYVGKPYSLIGLGRKIARMLFDRIIVLTERDRENYIRNFTNSNKIIQIYNPIENLDTFSNKYSVESRKILSCGFLVEQKGFDYAISIAKLVLAKHEGWTWEILGDGLLRTQLEEKIRANGLEGRLILRGYADNMLDRYKDYSIFALTSRFEGLGMVLIEALQAGLPSVSFDINAGPDELICDGVNGYLVPAFDVVMYAEKLCELIDSAERRKIFSKCSHRELYKMERNKIINCWIENIICKD